MAEAEPVATLEMFGRTRGAGEFPASWGDPPGDRYSASRADWVATHVGIEIRKRARGRIGQHRADPAELRRQVELTREPPWGPMT